MVASPWKCVGCGLVNASELPACRRCSGSRDAVAAPRENNPYAPPRAESAAPPAAVAALPIEAATARDRLLGPAYTDLGFKTWWIVCHDDAFVFVRAPWFLGVPIVVLLGVLVCLPIAWLTTTVTGRNHSLVGSTVMAIASVVATVALVRAWPRLAGEWRDRMARSSTAEITRSTEALAFEVARVQSLRLESSNELRIRTTDGESKFGVYSPKAVAELTARYPRLAS